MGWLRGPVLFLLDAVHSVVAHEPDRTFLCARTLVFAPHQDDEVLGCGGTIIKKVDACAPVRVVFLTDGSSSHRRWMSANDLAALRREEALSAAQMLGLRPQDVTFLELPDGDLEGCQGKAVDLVRRVIMEFDPEEVFVPHSRDRLADHVATFKAVRAALESLGRPVQMREYPVWLWHTWPWCDAATSVGRIWETLGDYWELAAGCRLTVNVRPELERKRAALMAHASQMSRHGRDPSWPVLGDVSHGDWLAAFFTGVERFRESRPCG